MMQRDDPSVPNRSPGSSDERPSIDEQRAIGDAAFLELFVSKVRNSEPPQGQEWVEHPPTVQDWARFKELLNRLKQAERRIEPKKPWAHPLTMIGRLPEEKKFDWPETVTQTMPEHIIKQLGVGSVIRLTAPVGPNGAELERPYKVTSLNLEKRELTVELIF